jgi:nitroreductase
MDGMNAIESRRSVRAYTPAPVEREVLGQLVHAATLAPSAMNEQLWVFSIVTDRQLLSQISRNAKALLLIESAQGSSIDHLREMLSDPKFEIFYGAPALIVISAPRHSQWAVEDCALAAENLMLAARAYGLGSCWIGFAQAWLGTPEGHSALQLDETLLPVAPIIVGHPKGETPSVPRRKPRVHWIG